MKPYLLKETYETYGVSVISVNAADYGVDPTGEKDSAPGIQAALDAARDLKGGTVYLPEGKYAIRTPITVHSAVTLRGEWLSPEKKENDLTKGTVLLIYVGKNDPDGQAAFSMKPCSGLKCLTFVYPEQSLDAPVPYSPAVRQNGCDSMTLENVTMVNPWRGVQSGPDANELHYLKNVYITPVNVGFFMDMTTDIGRMENLNIKPDYCARYFGAPVEAVREFTLKNATGVYMARSDWEYGYEIHVEWCRVGFLITSFTNSGPNSQLSGLRMYNCDIGFHLVDSNPYGVALSDSEIVCDIPLTAAIKSDARFKTVMQINGCTLAGPYRYTVDQNGSGQISFVNASISGWQVAAVNAASGGLSFLQCDFEPGKTHFETSAETGGLQILGCEFGGKPLFSGEGISSVCYSAEKTELSVASRGGHLPCTTKTCPDALILYNAVDFGAVGDGATDNTAALSAALEAAGKTGGVVYVPGGLYLVAGQLSVPAGVQMRGVFEVPSHTMGTGSVLMTTANKGTEDGDPFITLGEGAGLFGLSLYYPEQNEVTPFAYPWTVQSRGKNCYLVNTVLVNPWQGVDFGTYPSDGHYISYISGAPIKCGIFCGNNAGDGWVENIQYNPHYYYRSSLPNHPTAHWNEFWHNQIKYLQALVFGYNEREHLLGTFVFAANHGLKFVMQDGKGCSGKFIGHGTDGGQNGLYIEGCGELELINTELVTIEARDERIYFLTAKDMPGKAKVYNTLMWGAPHRAMVLQGGDLEIQQTNIVDPGRMAITVDGGRVTLAATYFYHNIGRNLAVNSDAEVTLLGSMTPHYGREPKAAKTVTDPRDGASILEIYGDAGRVTEKYTYSK